MIFFQCWIHSLFRVATLQGININSKLYTLLKVTKEPWSPKFQNQFGVTFMVPWSYKIAKLKLHPYILFIADM